MAEEEQAPDNPFLGMGFGAAVRKLRDNPDLAGKFDEVFKDEQDVDTLERARLSHVNSLYRQSTTGALALKGMHDVATSPQPEEVPSTPEQQSFDRWAQRLAQGTQRNKEYVPVTKKSQWEDIKKQYDSTLDDLANYDRMSNSIGALTPEGFIDPWASEAAILGSLSGGLVAIENTAFLPLKGLTPLARVVSGAIQGGVVNAATDPIVQKLNQQAGVQGEWDFTRTALSFPMGAVINGGIVGMGEVLTRNVIRSERANLAKSDPSLAEPLEVGVVAPKSEFAPGAKVDDKPLFPKEETSTEVSALKEGETPSPEIPEIVARQPGGLRAEPTPSPNYQRPPETVKSLQTMVGELEDAFGVPIRQGRVGVKGALGTFHRDTGVIHVQEYPDFSVSAHEVAHALDERLGGALSKTKGDLNTVQQQFANELRPLDYDQDPIMGQRVHEGFAEFMRLYMTNPAYVQRNAPGFYSTFSNLMERTQPEVLEKLVGFQKAYKNYLEATPEQIIAAGIVAPKSMSWGDKIVARLTDAKVAPTIKNILSLSYDAFIHKDEDINRAFRALGTTIKEKTGKLVDVLPSEDPTYLFKELRAANQTAMNHLAHGVPKFGTDQPVGPSLAQVLSTAVGKSSITGQWNGPMFQKFEAYVKSLMGIVRWTQFDHGLVPNAPFAESKDYFKQLILQYNKEFPQFQQAANMLNEYNRNVRERARDAGVVGFTSDKVDEWNKLPFYAPMYRSRDDIQPGGNTGLKSAPQGVKKFEGSMRDVISPISSIIQDNVAIEKAIAHNRFMDSLAKWSKAAGAEGGRFLERLPAHEVQAMKVDLEQVVKTGLKEEGYGGQDATTITNDFLQNYFANANPSSTAFKMVIRDGRKEPIVFWGESGEVAAARVTTKQEGFGIYELLQTVPKPMGDLAVQFMNLVSSAQVISVVTHPFYALRNLFRDQRLATALIPGYRPGIGLISGGKALLQGDVKGALYNLAVPSWAEGMVSAMRNDKFAQAYREHGGTSPGMQYTPHMDEVKVDIDNLAKQGFSVRKIASLEGVSEAVSIAEKATRLGVVRAVYNEKKRLGLSDFDAMSEATRESSDLLDFNRHGSQFETTRKITPFIGAWIQSLDKLARAAYIPVHRAAWGTTVFAKDKEQISTAMRAWGVIGVTGFAGGMMKAALFWDKDGYRDAGPKVKSANHVIPLGDDTVFLVPKSWELDIPDTMGEYAFASWMKSDPRAGEQFRQAAFEALAPPAPVFANATIKPVVESISNYNFFTGRPIVSEQWEKVAPEYQARGRTSIIGKKLAETFGISPLKVDHVLGSFGYYGKDMVMLSKGDEQQDPTSNLIDWTLLRAGIKDPTMLSDAREKFWKHMGRTTGDYAQAVETFKMLRRSEKGEQEALAYFSKLPNNRKAWVVLNEGADEEGKKAFTADDRRAHALTRSADAVSVLNGVRNELTENRLVNGESKDILMTPDSRKKLAQVVGQMALAEMVNGLIVTKEPGYTDRKLFDMNVFMDRINAISPEAAEEVKSRYAGGSTSGKKIYRWDNVAKAYDPMQSALITNGSQADLSLITEDVTSGGYEFGSERRKKAPVRRGRIEVR